MVAQLSRRLDSRTHPDVWASLNYTMFDIGLIQRVSYSFVQLFAALCSNKITVSSMKNESYRFSYCQSAQIG